MKNIHLIILSSLIISFYSPIYSQEESEESSEGGDSSSGGDTGSAASSAISGSVAAPSVTTSGAIEGNSNIALVRLGMSLTEALAYTPEQAGSLVKKVVVDGIDVKVLASLDPDEANLAFQSSIFTAFNAVKELSSYVKADHNEALIEAATLANTLLVDRSISSSSDLPSSVSVNSFVSSGYNVALINLLSKYGAIGSNGDSVVSGIFTGALNDSLNNNSDLSNKTSTADFLSYLSVYTGNAAFGDIDATSTVLDLPVQNITVSPGANVDIGTASTSSSIDVSSLLPESSSNHRSGRKVHVIGAAKDIKISGSTTFTNTNDTEDHALVLGAADDFMLNGSDLTYTGSNLALGAGGSDTDTMYLVNTTITTGGNLAAGTLGTLNVSSANFNVGNGGANSDPDNVYLFANDLIQINGLSFSGSRLDDVYMEAITVNLNNVAFPSTADVILKSRDGTLHFDTYSAPVVGSVNLTNVAHGSTALSASYFDNGPAGHIDSTITLPNGKSAVKIRKQY